MIGTGTRGLSHALELSRRGRPTAVQPERAAAGHDQKWRLHGQTPNDVLRVWDAIRGQELARLEHLGAVLSLGFVSEHELVIVEDERCRLWDVGTRRLRTVLDMKDSSCPIPGGRLETCAVTPDGKTLALATHSSTAFREKSVVLLLSLPSGTVMRRLPAPAGADMYFAYLVAAGSFLAAGGRHERGNALAVLWDVQQGKRLRTYDLPTAEIDDLALHADGPGLATFEGGLGSEGRIRSFGMETEEELEGFTPFPCKGVLAMRYSCDGRVLEVITWECLVRLDAATGQPLASQPIPSDLDWDTAALDPSGSKVALAADREIEVLDLLD